MRNLLALALALAATSCDDTPAGRPAAAADALWNLAPAGARGGIVVSPYAMAMIESGTFALRSFLGRAGVELAPIEREVDALLAPIGGRDAKLADLGLSRDRGGALFFVKDGMIVIAPIADRDRFLAKQGGTKGVGDAVDRVHDYACKPVAAYYACASSEPLLGTLGHGMLRAQLAKAGVRGDIEVVGTELSLGGPAGSSGRVVAAAQLERGTITVRGIVGNPPPELFRWLVAPVRPRTQIGRSAGAVVLDLRAMFANVASAPLLEGLTLGDVTNTIAGPLTISVPAGEAALDMELPLSDPAPAARLVAGCGDVALLAQLGAQRVDGACRIHVEQAGLELDLWVEGTTFHIGRRGAPAVGRALAMSPVGLEIANDRWGFAIWGRGTLFAAPPVAIDPRSLLVMRAMSVVDELGVAARKETTSDGDAIRFLFTLRTSFANPDAVIAQLAAITASDIAANTAGAKAKSIAEAYPRSPFADDLAAGHLGLIAPSKLINATIQSGTAALARYFGDAKRRPVEGEGVRTRQRVEHYATKVFPEWARANPGKPCPGSIAELAAFVSRDATSDDEWDRPLVVLCGNQLPAGVSGIAVVSAGADGTLGTTDDIKSY